MGRINKLCRKLWFWLAVALAAGILARAAAFVSVPGGLNQDEASIGYDAWSILYYGVDRNGTRLPVHLISWGSGQNALYAYLSMPFIAVFGLNVFSVRIVNLLCGIGAIPAVYYIVKKLFSGRCAAAAALFTAIAPWGIMTSRWGLESNLFPYVFLFAVCLLVKSLERKWYFPASSAVFSVSLYAYGAAYAVVPVFLLITGIYLMLRDKLPVRVLLSGVGAFIVLAVPIGAFILTNLMGWGDVAIGPFTAPELTGTARFSTVTGLSSLANNWNNFFTNVIRQNDGLIWNSAEFYGAVYVISFPLWVYGIFIAFVKKGCARAILFAWFFAALLLFFVYSSANVNRVNIVYPPLILFTAVGIDGFIGGYGKTGGKTADKAAAEENRRSVLSRAGTVIAAYAFCFLSFLSYYFGDFNKNIKPLFYDGAGEAIRAACQIEGEPKIYVTSAISYTLTLFYSQISPETYRQTVKIQDMDVEFQQVTSFGRFVCSTSAFGGGSSGVYILRASDYSSSEKQVIGTFSGYTVVFVP